MSFPGRKMAAGPGDQPATECGVFEGLRKVAERQAVCLELLLQPRTSGPGLNPGRERCFVQFEQAAHSGGVEGEDRTIRISQAGLDAAANRSATTEGDDRRTPVSRPLKNLFHTGLVFRKGDQVRRVLEKAIEAANDVAVGLAERVDGPLMLSGSKYPAGRTEPGFP